jgi:hypothetical protein
MEWDFKVINIRNKNNIPLQAWYGDLLLENVENSYMCNNGVQAHNNQVQNGIYRISFCCRFLSEWVRNTYVSTTGMLVALRTDMLHINLEQMGWYINIGPLHTINTSENKTVWISSAQKENQQESHTIIKWIIYMYIYVYAITKWIKPCIKIWLLVKPLTWTKLLVKLNRYMVYNLTMCVCVK